MIHSSKYTDLVWILEWITPAERHPMYNKYKFLMYMSEHGSSPFMNSVLPFGVVSLRTIFLYNNQILTFLIKKLFFVAPTPLSLK